MKTLNLVYSNKSDIQYKISQFPDGQLVKEFSLAEIREQLNSY